MAAVAYPGGSTSIVNKTAADKFIPEIWSDEVIAAYKKSLVLANLVNKMTMKGKKGDTLHIPKPTRGVATAKAANTTVTIQADTETEVLVSIDQHFEYSRFIEDIVEVQALASLRRFYTDDAGYALAKKVDDTLFLLSKSFGNGDGSDFTHSTSFYIDTSTGLTAYAEDTVVSADVVMDIQRIKSNVQRGILDSLAQSIHPRTAIVEGQANMEDVLNTEVGAVIRMRAPGMVQPFTTPFVGQAAFPMLDYLDDIKQTRTGISRLLSLHCSIDPYTQGLTVESIHWHNISVLVASIVLVATDSSIANLTTCPRGVISSMLKRSSIAQINGCSE